MPKKNFANFPVQVQDANDRNIMYEIDTRIFILAEDRQEARKILARFFNGATHYAILKIEEVISEEENKRNGSTSSIGG